MAKQTINFGSPPLGMGGDTYKSAFEKCNLNFTELYDNASSKYSLGASNQVGIYKDVATFHNKTNALKGAIVIHLPKARNKSNTMSLWTIQGYDYTTSNGAWELKVGGYNYTSGWLQYSANLEGPAPFDQVQLGWATDHQVIILGLATTTWSYPIIHIPELLTGYSNIGNWEDVTIAVETVLTGYTKLVTPVLYGNNRVRAAEALLYARSIGGKPFDGTADIDLPGVNTEGNQNTTGRLLTEMSNGVTTASLKATTADAWNLASKVTAKITNNNNALMVHVGGAMNERKVMIQAGHASTSYANVFGDIQLNPLGGAVSVNGSPVLTAASGNAVSATKLQTARAINGVNFDGSANITVADDTKLPLAGGTITGALTVNGRLSVSQFSSTGAYSFLNGSAAQSIMTGGLLASSSYADLTKVPTNGIYSKGKVQADGGFQGALTGNASTATKLQTARTINGESFDGTANISFHNLDPQLIPANANFNSYTTPGMYYCPANATASTLVNRPTGNAFSLLVERHAGVKQTVTEYMANGHKTYVRNMYANTWGPWVRVHTTIDAPLGGQFLGNQETKAIAYNAKNISENVTIPGDVNALSAGPIEINTGKTVTITDGATWTIV